METRHGASSSQQTAASNKPLVFSKMESLVREMQDSESGIPIRSQKLFLTSIPSAFMGYDLVEWLMDRLDIDDSAEAIHLANLLCQYGYFFPVGETRSLIVKDDSSLYRFQTPYYWPSQNYNADTTDYAIYLTKRMLRNKQKHGLEDYELDAYNKLKKALQHKWDFVVMQAEEQVRLAKDRKKGDKIVTDSQERAYWRVHRPPPGGTNALENAPVPDRNNMANRVKKKTVDSSRQEMEIMKGQIERTRMKASVAGESLISYTETFAEYDSFLTIPQPSNPWITDDLSLWCLNESIVDTFTEKRAKRWAISFQELVNDQTGLAEFASYLSKEYSHENIRFWQSVLQLRFGPASNVPTKVREIFEEFLKPGAPCEINIDGKTMETTQLQMKTPSRYTYDLAAEHVYALLLKKDCYPRFLRSEHYKNLLSNAIQPSQKKKFFSFGGPGKKKPFTSAITGANSMNLQAQTPQPLKRLGSDEQAATSGPAPTGSEALVQQCSSLIVFHPPKVECDPPYSSTIERSGNSSVCPWDEGDQICPWETTTLPQKSPPPKSSPHRLVQSLHSLPPKCQLSKPTKPDRSKSMEVAQKPPATTVASTLTTIPSTISAEGSPASERSEKAQSKSLDVCPWEGQSPIKRLSSSPSTSSSPKELFLTALNPAEELQLIERRASEGLLRIGLGVCPTEQIQMTEKLFHKDLDVRINVHDTDATSREITAERKLDQSVRSGHLREVLETVTGGIKEVTRKRTQPTSEIELSIASSMVPLTCLTSSSDEQVVKMKEQSTVETVTPKSPDATKGETSKETPKVEEKSLAKSSEEQQKSQPTDVCPWEDEEACKEDVPFVKHYQTFGYL